MAEHGTYSRYTGGCRCAKCKAAARERYAKKRADPAWCAREIERKRERRRHQPRKPRPEIPPERIIDEDRYFTPKGYVRVRSAGKDEHIVVMERLIGRPLKKGEETVHHRNGIKHDNAESNLELWTSSHPAGKRVVDLLAWARELLAEYEPVEDRLP